MAAEKQPGKQPGEQIIRPELQHAGGVSDSLGGVDPDVEDTLLRLSGGP